MDDEVVIEEILVSLGARLLLLAEVEFLPGEDAEGVLTAPRLVEAVADGARDEVV